MTEKKPGVPIGILNQNFSFTTRTRPLAEFVADSSTKRRLQALGTHFGTEPCDYPDSRRGKRINAPAKEEIDNNRQAFLDSLAWINYQYFKGNPPEDITVEQAHEMSIIIKWLPSYLVFRAENHVDKTQLPVSVGGMYKAALGINAVTLNLLLDGQSEAIITPQKMYSIANSPQFEDGEEYPSMLIAGPRACAEETDNIIQAGVTLFSGQGGNWRQSELSTLIDPSEFDNLKKVAFAANSFERFEESITFEHQELEDKKKRAALSGNPISSSLYQAQLQMFLETLTRQKSLSQRELNIGLGRDPDVIE